MGYLQRGQCSPCPPKCWSSGSMHRPHRTTPKIQTSTPQPKRIWPYLSKSSFRIWSHKWNTLRAGSQGPAVYGGQAPHRRGNPTTDRFFSGTSAGRWTRYTLRICRFWGQAPDWIGTLDSQTLERIIADYIIENETDEDRKTRKQEQTRRAIKKAHMRSMEKNG